MIKLRDIALARSAAPRQRASRAGWKGLYAPQVAPLCIFIYLLIFQIVKKMMDFFSKVNLDYADTMPGGT